MALCPTFPLQTIWGGEVYSVLSPSLPQFLPPRTQKELRVCVCVPEDARAQSPQGRLSFPPQTAAWVSPGPTPRGMDRVLSCWASRYRAFLGTGTWRPLWTGGSHASTPTMQNSPWACRAATWGFCHHICPLTSPLPSPLACGSAGARGELKSPVVQLLTSGPQLGPAHLERLWT